MAKAQAIRKRDIPAENAAATGRDPSARQLLERYIARRDEAAFAALVKRYGGTVWRVCRRFLQEQDAEDAFQAVFVLLARKAASIRKPEAVGSWLYGVAYRTAMKARRSLGRRQKLQRDATGPQWEASAASEASCRELQSLLDAEVQRLGDKYRVPFVLCCLEGLTRAEAARELGLKEGTVANRLTGARKLLHRRLLQRGISLSALLTAATLTESFASASPPAVLLHTTVQAVAGKAAALSPKASALSQAMLHSMTVAKIKGTLACAFAVIVMVTGAGFAAFYATADPPAPTEAPPALIQPEPPAVLMKSTIEEQILTLAFSPDGKRLVTAGASLRPPKRPGQLIIWDVVGAKEMVKQVSSRGIRAAAFSPDGKTLATGEFGGDIKLLDPISGREQTVLKGHTVGVNSLAFSPDGAFLASAGLDRVVKVWDLKRLKEHRAFRGHTDSVLSVAYFHHAQAIVSCGKDRTARIWDLNSGAEKLVLRGHLNAVEAVAVSPDDSLVATASWDKTVRLWEAKTGKQTAVLEGSRRAVFTVTFSPDGKLLAYGTGNGMVGLWDVTTRRRIGNLGRHFAAVWTLAFTRDGKYLASGSADKTAKLWNVAGMKSAVGSSARPVLFGATSLGVAASPGGDGVFHAAGLSMGIGLGGMMRDFDEEATFDAREFKPIRALAASLDGKVIAAADWPAWRGPEGNGIRVRASPVTTWSQTAGVRWKATVPGRGHASPVVVGERVFVSSAEDHTQTRSLFCYHRETGALLWHTAFESGGFMAKHKKNSHASPTPACDGRQLYIPFISQDKLWLSAIDTNGDLVWRRLVGPFTQQGYSPWGYASSPVLYKDLVIVAGENTGASERPGEPSSYIAAVQRHTGAVVWRTPRPRIASYGTPVVAHVAGRDQLLLSGPGRVTAFDPASGRELWFYRWSARRSANSVVCGPDCVYASATWPEAQVVCVRADGNGDVTASHLVWRQARGACDVPSPLYHQGRLYLVNDKGVMTCLDGATGKMAWQKRLGAPFSASPVAAGDHVYATDEEGTTHVIKVQPVVEDLASNPVGEPVLASLALSGNDIFLRSQNALWCLDGKTQEFGKNATFAAEAPASTATVPVPAANLDRGDESANGHWVVWLLGGAAILVLAGVAAFFWPRIPRTTEATPKTALSLAFACAGCGKRLKGKPALAGKKVKCPQCGRAVLVPDAGQSEPSPAAPLKRGKTPAGLLALLSLCSVVLVAAILWLTAAPSAGSVAVPSSQEEFFQSFKGAAQAWPRWDRCGPDSNERVRFELDGVHITLPRGFPGDRPYTGLSTQIEVDGDFEMTVRFEFLPDAAAHEPSNQHARFTLDAVPFRPGGVNLSRSFEKDGKQFFGAWYSLPDEITGKDKSEWKGVPTQTMSGRLRLVRKGKVVFFYLAEENQDDFLLLQEYQWSSEPLKEVRLVGWTGGPQGSLKVRICDFHLRADKLTNLLPSVGPASFGMATVIVLLSGGIVIALGVLIGVWLRERRVYRLVGEGRRC